jgi:hypothetical protein
LIEKPGAPNLRQCDYQESLISSASSNSVSNNSGIVLQSITSSSSDQANRNREAPNINALNVPHVNALDANDLETEYSINELLVMAKNGVFRKKMFLVASKTKRYTPILHFFTFIRRFNSIPKDKITFVCKEAGCKLQAPIGDFSNINKHIINKPTDHSISKEWYDLYKKSQKTNQTKRISDESLNL